MGRSQLLKDLVGGNSSMENVLLRLKIIFSDLDNQSLKAWIIGELEGYREKDDVPHYRVVRGIPTGTFMVNQSFQYKNAQVPIDTLLPPDLVEEIVTLRVTDSVGALQTILNGQNSDKYAKQVPTSLCHSISSVDLQIAGMNVIIPSNRLDGIVSKVKSKLVDVIMELEKQFENLDDLDIRSQLNDDTSQKEQMIYNIEKIIYEGSIEIGDSNTIKSSKFGKFFGGKK